MSVWTRGRAFPPTPARALVAAAVLAAWACSDELLPPTPHAVRLEALSPVDQVGPAGARVNELPEVRAVDADGAPVAGVAVTFTASGGSAAEPSRETTGEDGVARVASWLLPQGVGELRAAAEGLDPVIFRAEGKPRTFDLTLRWITEPSMEGRTAVEAAEAIIESIIWEDLPDEELVDTPVCPRSGRGPAATLDEVVDDVLILVTIEAIDGLGGAGAQGYPCLIRDPGTQTIVGFVRFDEAEFAAIGPDLRREFALHEMVHALGFVPGILNIQTPSGFARSCLALPSSGPPNQVVQDTHFSCPHARKAFDLIGGASYTGAKVPLENGATTALTANTLNHHWRKTSFRNELMTGWFTPGVPAPLSVVTVGALEDLDYAVSYAGAEPFLLLGNIETAPSLVPAGARRLVEPPVVPPAAIHLSRR
ncbi:MAG: hypothetical protein AMXMBFR53_02140 [Gemmatimonadota bacterium]